MKNIKNLLKAIILSVGIGALIEAFISLFLGRDIIGMPKFIESVSPGHARIIQTILYGGFGLISDIISHLLKIESDYTRPKQAIHFGILGIYFIFIGLYLGWFDLSTNLFYSAASFIIVYLLIGLVFYYKDKKTIDEVNKKLSK